MRYRIAWSFAPSCLLLTGIAHAQCATDITPGPGMAGLDDRSAVSRWDPDGNGPANELLVFFGEFRIAGSLLANHLATYDPLTGAFAALGSGFDGDVTAVTVTANNDLVAVGNFTTAGGVAAPGVARWNGTAWSGFGSGFAPYPQNDLRAVAELQNGDIVVGGSFDSMLATYSGLARWDGATWSPIPGLAPAGGYPTVMALMVQPNGDLLVGGNFSTAGGIAANSFARWDGSNWHDTSTGLASGVNGSVWTLSRLQDGSIVVGGQFSSAGGYFARSIARWTGTTWDGMGGGMQPAPFARVTGSSVAPNGDLIVTGGFQTAGGVLVNNIARWDGSWHALGNGLPLGGRSVLALAANDIVLTGGFVTASPRRWDGSTWSTLQPGLLHLPSNSRGPEILLQRQDGSLLVGASYTYGTSEATHSAHRVDGGIWSPIGTDLVGTLRAAVELPNLDIIVGGGFRLASTPNANIARWDGSSWSQLGAASPNGSVHGLALMPNGDLVAVGSFTNIGGVAASRAALWNGSSWSSLGSGVASTATAVALLPNGNLVVAGLFTQAGGGAANHIAQWNGVSWSPLGTGLDAPAYGMAVLPNGDLIVSGIFTTAGGVAANGIARWDGSQWNALGAGVAQLIEALAVLPGGDLAVGTRATGAGSLLRWDGTNWPQLANVDNAISSLLVTQNGELFVGGAFLTVDGQASPLFAQLSSTCPASAASVSSGCVGAGGTLSALSGAWTGGSFRSVGENLPILSVVGTITGFSGAALPLAAVFPSAMPGCTLLAAPDIVAFGLTTSGTAQSQLAIPDAQSLAGLVFHHQMLVVDLTGSAAVTTTNKLTVTIGNF